MITHTTWGLDYRGVHWTESAACNLDNADWFDVVASGHGVAKLSLANEAALQLCASCPVRQPCLEAAEAEPPGHSRRRADPHIAGGKVFGLSDTARARLTVGDSSRTLRAPDLISEKAHAAPHASGGRCR